MASEGDQDLSRDEDISYAQFRALANSMPNLAWMANPDGWVFWYNKRWYDYTGTAPDEMLGWGWQSVHHPDILPLMLENWTTALRTGEPFEMTFPLRRGSDGSYRTFVTRAEPLREQGRIVGWFGTNTDITDQERTRERLQLVVNELNHRVKNTLSTVQSIAVGSFRGADKSSLGAFESRLLAMSRVHDLLTRDSWSSTPIRDIIAATAAAFGDARFDIEHCDATVEANVASALAMTFHELGTNAAKYGSLSNHSGRVRISCRIERLRNLAVVWTELGGPEIATPPADGFGLRLIRRALAGDSGASVDHRFEPSGVVCTITLPLGDGG